MCINLLPPWPLKQSQRNISNSVLGFCTRFKIHRYSLNLRHCYCGILSSAGNSKADSPFQHMQPFAGVGDVLFCQIRLNSISRPLENNDIDRRHIEPIYQQVSSKPLVDGCLVNTHSGSD